MYPEARPRIPYTAQTYHGGFDAESRQSYCSLPWFFHSCCRTSRPKPSPRARDLGVPFDGTPGPFNAITDVKGVEVGHTTLISGSGPLKVGVGPVRTGVTAILPRGHNFKDSVFAGWFTLNGNGEMTGTTWVEDSGFLDGPVMITNTHSVGVVRDAVIAWRVKHAPPDEEGYWWSLPVVAETWDGDLNDINGFHVKPEDAFHALDTAKTGPVEEGSVGGGTGMICNEFKGGIGTSSRVLDAKVRRLHGRSAGAVQLRTAQPVAHRRSSGRTRDRRAHRSRRRRRIDHRGRGYRCAADSNSTEARGPESVAGLGPGRQLLRRRLGRHLHRVLHRESRRRPDQRECVS